MSWSARPDATVVSDGGAGITSSPAALDSWVRQSVFTGVIALTLLGAACSEPEAEADTSPSDALSDTSPTSTPKPSATPLPGQILVVTTVADDGPGSLRQRLHEALPGDSIVFLPATFPPQAPATISVVTSLPQIVESDITIDASDAGVILDGSELPQNSWLPGLEILADRTTVRGLQVLNFTGAGIAVAGGQDNVIGGDRDVGTGRFGQGNMVSSNDFGIGIWDQSASGNVVTGNLIGTDPDGVPAGNANAGVWVTEGASGNIIGPDNVIAHSGRCGVEIERSNSARNSITRNSIQHSDRGAICLMLGANHGVVTPLIEGVDPAHGMVSGTACGGCTVEIFSDDGDEAGTYEGMVIAEPSGAFAFTAGGALGGSSVTVTATDRGGNTSALSLPAGALGELPRLQEGSRHARTPLESRPSGELRDNRVAATLQAPELWIEIDHAHGNLRDHLLDLGIKRLDTSLNEVEPPITWEASEFDVPTEYDALIDAMVENGVAVNYLLHFWDKAGHARGEPLATPRFATQVQIDAFIEYVRFIVGHFRGRVAYYTIWSEPDACGDGGLKCIRPSDYVELARQVIPVIREEDPQAQVVVAPPVLFFERDFLPYVMSSDVAAQFDVVQWHGQYDVRPDNSFYGAYYYEYRSIVDSLREMAGTSGFDGEYWSTDMDWDSEEFPHFTTGDQPWVVNRGSDKTAAKYYARAIILHLGRDISPGIDHGRPPVAPWSYPVVRRLNTVMAGAHPIDIAFTLSAETNGLPTEAYAFEMPDGEVLIAVWTDAAATHDDQVIVAELTLSGVATDTVEVSGLDVLYGFEQPLSAIVDGRDVVVSDLAVVDYPRFVRITPLR